MLSAPEDYWSEIRRTLDEIDAQQISTFDGFTDDEAQRCIARSTIIECAAGDRVLKSGGTARNIFVVLDGTLEVRDGDAIVNVLSAGDAFGEMAFLLERPRRPEDRPVSVRFVELGEALGCRLQQRYVQIGCPSSKRRKSWLPITSIVITVLATTEAFGSR